MEAAMHLSFITSYLKLTLNCYQFQRISSHNYCANPLSVRVINPSSFVVKNNFCEIWFLAAIVIAIKPEGKETYRTVAIYFFDIMQKTL
jgi:hypothetical protein